jgi:hypothetical protein
VSGIGGRVPRYVGDGTPGSSTHHIWQILPLMIDARTRRVGVMPKPAAVQADVAFHAEVIRKTRHVAAALRREQQRQARIAAGVDRSSPDAGPRPRWSR